MKGIGSRTALAALLLWCACPGHSQAADEETACHAKNTTVDIMVCLDGLTGQWDRRLNAAYQVALKASESPTRRQGLITAERAWLKFRTANCGWYDSQEGTIREIAGADCMLDMTRGRAVELEDALKP